MAKQGTCSVFRGVINNNTNLTPNLSPDFNETIHFSGDTKTYKELVYTSRVKETLNLSIEVLTNESKTSRLAIRNVKKGTRVIPRPQNAWIIYRRDKYADPRFEGIKSCIASVIIGKEWRSATNEVVEYFVALSMLALENHQKKYGDYKYQPKQKIISKKSKIHKTQSKEDTSPETKILTDLPQFVVPANEYPTPVSSISHSPVASQDDFPVQTNNNSYLNLITPASSNQHSPVTFQDDFLVQTNNNSYLNLITPASSNQHSPVTFQDGFLEQMDEYSFIPLENELMNFNDPTIMYPDLNAITPADNFPTYNNNNSPVVSNNVSQFLHDADILATTQSSPNTTTSMDVNIQDFALYPENETLMFNIIPSTVEATADQLLQSYNLYEYDNYDPFSINIETPFLDQLDYYDNNGHPYSQ